MTAPLAHLEPAGAACLRARARRLQHEPAAGTDDHRRATSPTAGSISTSSTSRRSRRRSPASSSNTASCSSTAATPASARRSSPSTSARARRTSASATKSTSCSTASPSSDGHACACSTNDGKPTDGRRSSSATRRAASIRRRPSAWRRTSPSTRRSIAPTARRPAAAGRLHRRRTRAARSTSTQTQHAHGRPASRTTRRPSGSSAGSIRPSCGWYSGDHHIHAAGCAHYENADRGRPPAGHDAPHPGRGPEGRLHADLGAVLDYQKQFFDGKDHKLSTDRLPACATTSKSPASPRSHAGHLCLLRLKEQDYPGHEAHRGLADAGTCRSCAGRKEQGAVVGFAHSGWGLAGASSEQLPNYEMPPFDGIGANEYIVDVDARRWSISSPRSTRRTSGS